jgi:Flp pilus assembly protein TadG
MNRSSAVADLRVPRRWRDDAGGAAVEFGLLLPVVVLLLFGIIEMGRAWNVRQTLTDAAREGARVAAVSNNRMSTTALQDSVRAVVRRSAQRAGLNTASLAITQTGVGSGTGNPVTVVLQYQYDPLFGSWVISREVLRMRASSVMRNE